MNHVELLSLVLFNYLFQEGWSISTW
jgi:hypothetical protein